MSRLNAEDLTDSRAAGTAFAQEMLVQMLAAEVPEQVSRTFEQVAAAARDAGYTPSESAEMVQAFVAGARAELARIAAAGGDTAMGRA
ncbi:hypothetical protein JMJ56_28115 [Belnapia sp. T18]|uniref:Pyrroline-5-carboxylate reductase n=1 Tax=Belnapia arida TaxID=2804533 RepID=A0ABS1UBE5_9PROT|nr:hypothetical protein [Belnapia arida]MBL6081855.1 hypothetical protein [Belnapia arida]